MFDLFLVLIFSPFWFIIFLIITVAIFFLQGRPIFFRQTRLGYKGNEIILIKFCSMKSTKSEYGKLLDDFERTTKLGHFLRKFSLDEIPSILNVLNNDMSLVGPRPFISDYKNLYNKRQMRRHDVLPGITGWAQINGRNSISWQEKFELDLWYVDNQSFVLDMKIILLTFWKVFRGKDINANHKSTTMPRFNGKN